MSFNTRANACNSRAVMFRVNESRSCFCADLQHTNYRDCNQHAAIQMLFVQIHAARQTLSHCIITHHQLSAFLSVLRLLTSLSFAHFAYVEPVIAVISCNYFSQLT
jgi:hypothetical protein